MGARGREGREEGKEEKGTALPEKVGLSVVVRLTYFKWKTHRSDLAAHGNETNAIEGRKEAATKKEARPQRPRPRATAVAAPARTVFFFVIVIDSSSSSSEEEDRWAFPSQVTSVSER